MYNKDIVICDIDGTISKVGEREKYAKAGDWEKFYADDFHDEPIVEVCNLVETLLDKEYEVVFITRRSTQCRQKTENWLRRNIHSKNLQFAALYMPDDENLADNTVIKPELLDKFLLYSGRKMEDIAFALEDDAAMVNKWVEMGITCLNIRCK